MSKTDLIVSAASLATRSIASKMEDATFGIKLCRFSLTIDTIALVLRETQLLINKTRKDPDTVAGNGLKGLPDVNAIIPPYVHILLSRPEM